MEEGQGQSLRRGHGRLLRRLGDEDGPRPAGANLSWIGSAVHADQRHRRLSLAAAVMTTYAAFRRQPVPQQYAQNLQTVTLPAPTRGIIQSENDAYMAPGGAIVSDNWVP